MPGKYRAHLVKPGGDLRDIMENFLEKVTGIVNIMLLEDNS